MSELERAMRPSWANGPARWALALASLWMAGCNTPGAKLHNLNELHGDDGRHQRIGVLMGDFGYAVRNGLFGLIGKSRVAESEPKTIKNPLRDCTRNCADLARVERDDPATLTQQVIGFARFAVDCPWKLSRDVCVHALGAIGERLHLADAALPPVAAEHAGPDEVGEAIRGLIAAYPRPSGDAAQPTLQDACAQLAALPLDRTGARLALTSVGILLSARRSGERLAPLRTLELDLQRRCVAYALAEAFADPEARVRAAAIESDVRIFGLERLREHLPKLREPTTSDDEVLAVLKLARERGLPSGDPSSGSSAEPGELDGELETVFTVATLHPEGRVRAAAMLTLAARSDAGFESLREEDWQEWMLARRASRQAAPRP